YLELHRNNRRLASANHFDRAVADALKARSGEMLRFLLQLLFNVCRARWLRANARCDERGEHSEDCSKKGCLSQDTPLVHNTSSPRLAMLRESFRPSPYALQAVFRSGRCGLDKICRTR